MLLAEIEATNFRNLSGKIFWGPRLNIIYGNNGQGKTNWLEAIYLLARTKSFRTQRLQEAIKFGEQIAVVRGKVTSGSGSENEGSTKNESSINNESSTNNESSGLERSETTGLERDLQVTLHDNSKTIFVNTKRESLTRYLTQLQVFSFTASDLEVVRGTPEARRRFLDRGVSSIRHAYLRTIADYNRVIKQKNKVLHAANESEFSLARTEDLIGPWNEQLAKLGAEIHREREAYVAGLNGVLERQLFERRDVTTRYVSSLEGKGDLADYESVLRSRLTLRLAAEVASGHALIGPHRDDLEIHLDGREIRAFGSSGQQRSALLILDLAAISLYNLHADDHPVFIIDDVDAELDEKRITHLLEYLENRTQTFITTSKRNHVEGFFSRANVYEIAEGKVRSSQSRSGQASATLV